MWSNFDFANCNENKFGKVCIECSKDIDEHIKSTVQHNTECPVEGTSILLLCKNIKNAKESNQLREM